MKKTMTLMTAIVTAMTVWAGEEQIGGYTWTYRIDGNTAEIYNEDENGYTLPAVSPEPTGDLTIPSTLGGKAVTIGNGAFADCSELTSVTIPASVRTIGESAFRNCAGITNVVIPDGVAVIGAGAFYNCNGLTRVVIPDSVTAVGGEAFGGCTSVTDATLPVQLLNPRVVGAVSGNWQLETDGSYRSAAIGDNRSTSMSMCIDGISIVVFSWKVSSQSGHDFLRWSLDGVEMGRISGTGTGWQTVRCLIPSCDAHTVTWTYSKDGGETDGNDCGWVRASIGNMGIYTAMPSPVRLLFPDSAIKMIRSLCLTGNGGEIPPDPFWDCMSLSEVTISSGVVNISSAAFWGGNSLTRVTIPNTVTNIGEEAFYGCMGLTGVTIPNGVTSIGRDAFRACWGLTSVTIPASVTSIGDGAFAECDEMRVAVVPMPLKDTIKDAADAIFDDGVFIYYYTGDVPHVEYTYNYIDNDDGTVTLSRYDENGDWLDDPIIPPPTGEFTVPGEIDGKRVVAIGDDVFDDSCMISLVIPASVMNISQYALPYSYALTNITVAADNPAYKSVDGILYTKNGKTLVACPGAKGGSIVVASGTEYIGEAAFYDNRNVESVTLPNGLKTIEYNAFGYCQNENFTSITVPASVKTIGGYAFGHCSELETVTFAGSEATVAIAPDAFAWTRYEAAKPFSLIIESGALIGLHGVAPENLVISDYSGGQTLTAIGPDALSGWSYDVSATTNIVIPDGVTSIGSYAFALGSALQSVTLPATLKSIEYAAFYNCSSLREIRIPAGAETLGYNLFDGCTDLTVYAPETLRDTFSVPGGCTIEYYEIPDFTVTLSANGGSFGGETTQTVTSPEGTLTSSLPMPVLDGYLFAGWFTAADGGTRVTAVTGNSTLYAHWVESPFSGMSEEYPWAVDGDGCWRNGWMPDWTNTWAEITVQGPCRATFQYRRVNGFLSIYMDGEYCAGGGNFGEWTDFSMAFRDSESHTIRFELDSTIYGGQPDSGLYYQIRSWMAVPIAERTITFNANGGSFDGEATKTVALWDGTETATIPEPVFGGYLFAGWFTAAAGGTQVTVVTDSTTLYAHWVESPFSGMSGNHPWTVDADGAWRSAPITHNQSTWVELAVTGTPCMVSFNWKTSSEEGCDLLHCYLDGEEIVSSVSGIMDDWQPVSIAVAESGVHTLRFEYTKDYSASYGEDCGWVADLETAAVQTRTLLLDLNDGQTAATAKSVVDGCAIGFLPDPVWNGVGCFRFCGWFTAAANGEEVASDTVVLPGWTRLYAHWQEIDPPANDNFTAATMISGASGSIGGTTADSSRETADLIPDGGNKEYRSTVWYRWTAPADGRYRFAVSDADDDRRWSCFVGITTGYDAQSGSWSDANARWGSVAIHAVSNEVYWIEVASWRVWEENEEFDFTLSWGASAANDEYEDAQILADTESGSVPGTLLGATIADNDCIWRYGDAERTVWYKWESPFTGKVMFTATADNDASDFLYLVATCGYDEDNGTWDDCGYDDGNTVVFDVEEGESYYVSLATWNDVVEGFTLSWRRVQTPANDNFANATVISGASGSVTGTNVGAGVEDDEPLPLEEDGNWAFGSTATVWWRWTAPANGTFLFETHGSDFDTVLGVYTGSVVDALERIAANDDDGGSTSAVTFDAVKGRTYYIAVGGYENDTGDIVLSWNRDDEMDDAIVDVGGGKTVRVPGSWLSENTDRDATDDAANGRKVWECYLLGLDPEDPNDDFQITRFWMEGNVPMFEYSHTEDGSGVSFVPRIRKMGKVNLSNEWQEIPENGDSTFRFFKVEVLLP